MNAMKLISDKVTHTKLNFAFLQYSALEFYSIPENDTYNSRELLLALGWLFSSNNVMETTVKSKIINSLLGKESSSQVSAQVSYCYFNNYKVDIEKKGRKTKAN